MTRTDWSRDDWKQYFEERAAIIEYDGMIMRPLAEKLAWFEVKTLMQKHGVAWKGWKKQ